MGKSAPLSSHAGQAFSREISQKGTRIGYIDMQKFTIDSSVFLSSLMVGDTFHKDSKIFFTSLLSADSIVFEPMTVFLEVGNILTKNGEKDLSKVFDSFSQFQILPIDEGMLQEALFIFGKIRLKTADAIIVWCAYVSESTIITWDRTLLRKAVKLVPPFPPREYSKKAV